MKVMIVKEVVKGDISPVAMFELVKYIQFKSVNIIFSEIYNQSHGLFSFLVWQELNLKNLLHLKKHIGSGRQIREAFTFF